MIRQTQTTQQVRTTQSSGIASASAAAAPTFSQALAAAAAPAPAAAAPAAAPAPAHAAAAAHAHAPAAAAAAAHAPAAFPDAGAFGNPADIQAYRLEQNVAFRATREALDEYFRDNPQGLDVEAEERAAIEYRLPGMINQVAAETQRENYHKVAKLIFTTLITQLFAARGVTKSEYTKEDTE